MLNSIKILAKTIIVLTIILLASSKSYCQFLISTEEGSFNVCSAESEFEIFLNPSTATLISQFEAELPEGINCINSTVSVYLNNNLYPSYSLVGTDPEHLIISISNLTGLTPSDNVTIKFMAKAFCDAVNQNIKKNNYKVTYNSGLVFEYLTNSYDVTYPELIVSTTVQTINGTSGLPLNRNDISIKNNGLGAVDNFTFKIKHDILKLQLTSVILVHGTVEIPLTIYPPVSGVYTFEISETDLINLNFLNGFAQNDEIIVKETMNVLTPPCFDNTPEEFRLNWGCNSVFCEENTNSIWTAYVNLPVANPIIVLSQPFNFSSEYCPGSSTPTTSFTITVTNNSTNVWDVAEQFFYTLYSQYLTDVVVSYNGNPLQSNTVFSGFVLGPQQSANLSVSYKVSCGPNPCGNMYKFIMFRLNYTPKCQVNSLEKNFFYFNYFDIQDVLFSSPTDIDEGTPETISLSGNFNISRTQNFQSLQNDWGLIYELTLPYGYNYVSNSATCIDNSNNIINLTYLGEVSNVHRFKASFPSTSINTRLNFSLNILLNCSSLTVPPTSEIMWNVYMDYGSGCNCNEKLVCDKSATLYNHCVITGPGTGCLTLSDFSVNRNTFGWPESFRNNSTLTVLENTPTTLNQSSTGVELQKVYEYDEFEVILDGSYLSTCNYDDVYAVFNYTAPHSVNLFEYIPNSAVFNTNSTSIPVNVLQIDEQVIGTQRKFIYYYKVPANLLSSGTLKFSARFKIIKDASTNDGIFEFPEFRGYYKADVTGGGNEFSDSYGERFYLIKPVISRYSAYSNSHCDIEDYNYVIITHGSYFVNEYRPLISYDDFSFLLPSGHSFDNTNNASLFRNGSLLSNLIPQVNLNTYTWSAFSSPLLFEKGNNYFSFKVHPSCQVANGNVDLNSNVVVRDFVYTNNCNAGNLGCPTSNSTLNTSYTYTSPILTVSPETDEPGVSAVARWDVRVSNTTSMHPNNVWLSMEQASTNTTIFDFTDFIDANTLSTLTSSSYIFNGKEAAIVHLGNIGTSKDVALFSTYSNCLPNAVDIIDISAGWSCMDYPLNRSSYAPCTPVPEQLTLTVKNADMQAEFTDVMNTPPYTLCSQLNYELLVTSTGFADMHGVTINIDLPDFVTILSGSSSITYNNNPLSLLLPANGGLINLTSLIPNFQPEDVIKVVLVLETACGFNLGDEIIINVNGYTNCNELVHLPQINQSIPISGAQVVSDLDLSITTSNPNLNYLQSTTINVSATGNNSIVNGNLVIGLTSGLSYNAGSSTIGEPIITNGGSTLTWAIPSPLNLMNFNFGITNNSALATTGQVTGHYDLVLNISCNAVNCPSPYIPENVVVNIHQNAEPCDWTIEVQTRGEGCGCNYDLAVVPHGGVPPYTYFWTDESTSYQVLNLCAGSDISVTVTDSQNCQQIANVVIPNNNFNIITTINNAHCATICNGNITVSAGAGVPPYQYLWSNDLTTPTISNLCSGNNYSVTITDSQGCAVTGSYLINFNSDNCCDIQSLITYSGVNCNVQGQATVIASNGAVPYTYLWTNDATTQSIQNLSQGYYAVTITDAFNCEKISFVHIDSICGVSDCEDCITSFSPLHNQKYVVSAWVKVEDEEGVLTYAVPGISISFIGVVVPEIIFNASGEIIDGWQRIEGLFDVPLNAEKIVVKLNNTASGNTSYSKSALFDDIRIHPFNSTMKSFVYDPLHLRVMAELDENNYATFYEYDEEGALIRVKKETVRGVFTINENRNNTKKTVTP